MVYLVTTTETFWSNKSASKEDAEYAKVSKEIERVPIVKRARLEPKIP